MKKKVLISIIMIIMCLTIVGCGKNANKDNTTTNNGSNTNKTDNNTNEPSDSLSISQVEGLYNNDLPLGLETNFVKLNGTEIVIRVQTSGSS